MPDAEALGDRLRRYAPVLEGQPLRVLLVADDRLRYEEAARLIGACSAAGVAAIRLADPGDRPRCREEQAMNAVAWLLGVAIARGGWPR